MNKIKFFIMAVVIAGFFTSCEDFNRKNFENYDELTRPKNLVNYVYSMTSTDFATLGDIVKKDIETAISAEQAKLTAKKNELKTAKTAADTARINSEYDALKKVVDASVATLKLDPKYVTGMFLKTNKYFNDTYSAADYAPLLLNAKYKSADVSSAVQLTYKYVHPADTAAIDAKNKFTMTVDDYNALGETANQPGQFDNFSATVDPDVFIPKLLAVKYPLAQKGDLRLVRYQYFVSPAATQNSTLYMNNGNQWIPFSKTEQFVYADSHEWIFDPTIILTPAKEDFLLLMSLLYKNDGKTYPAMEGLNEWTSADVLRLVINPAYPPASETDFSNVRTEFFFGSSWYYLNIDIRITARIYNADKELFAYFEKVDKDDNLNADAKKEAKTTFMEKRAKQGLAFMLALKYPDLVPEVKGVKQFAKVNVQVYDGARWYWTYKYQCVEKGKFKYVERTKWK